MFGAQFQILPAKLPGYLNHCSRKLRMGGLSFPPLVGLGLFPQPGVTFILFRSLWSKLQSKIKKNIFSAMIFSIYLLFL